MNTFESPLRTKDDAKSYFQAMGCSHFHMSREFPERYSEYKALNISGDTEIEWKEESLKEAAESVEDVAAKDIWWVHSRMEDLAKGLSTIEALEIVFQFTQRIEEKLTPTGKMLVSETICGRQDIKFEPGLIFLAHNLNREDIAREFCRIAIKFADEAAPRLPKEHARCDGSTKKARAIARHLNLKLNEV